MTRSSPFTTGPASRDLLGRAGALRVEDLADAVDRAGDVELHRAVAAAEVAQVVAQGHQLAAQLGLRVVRGGGADDAELALNPRARSAVLRVAERLPDGTGGDA